MGYGLTDKFRRESEGLPCAKEELPELGVARPLDQLFYGYLSISSRSRFKDT
jgi:hypothetical protein